MKEQCLGEIKAIKEFFERSSGCLAEEDSSFAPVEGALTAAQQVAHAAQSIDWFVDGMTQPEGFDMDFEKHWTDVLPITSLTAARQWFAKSIQSALDAVDAMSEDDLSAALPDGPIMGGQPRSSVIGGMMDHTAHHRGALTVYARLLGKIPQMPYMG